MSKYRQILTKYWGYPNFRPLQEDIIKSVMDDKKDTLGLLPTGGGKSIIFQVPAMSEKGFCIVVTPLIALMKDQVENLKKRNIPAVAIYSGMSSVEIDLALNNAVHGAYKFLYLSPERLSTKIFLTRLPDMNVNLIAIDEAHCISQWGYDFRPAYMNIAEIRKYKPEVPFIALTATATPKVAIDIQEKLGFKELNLFQKSFERKNLIYIVRNTENKLKYLLKILNKQPGTAVVYVRNRKKTVEIANFLRENRISADYYHAGIDSKLKDFKQTQWKHDKIRVIVSTNAFGMGIDKDDVRLVVHIDLPDSPEAYFQEAGRGGRDGKTAYAVLLYNEKDKVNIERRIETSFPEREKIKEIYNSICNYYELPVGEGKGLIKPFKIRDFVKKFKLSIFTVFSSLKFLQNEGYLDFTEDVFISSKVHFIKNRDELYEFQIKFAKFDNFIKLLLRKYTGLFSKYVNIDEENLAKTANTKIEVIYSYLQKLHQAEIIKYIPQRKHPFITFTEERLDNKNLRLSKANYEDKKERFMSRINAMLHYAESTAKCRSQILLTYFGEKNPYRCGQCDVCRRRNELNMSRYEFDLILDSAKVMLRETPMSLETVIDKIDSDEKKIVKAIRWLLENEKVNYNKDNLLEWTKR